MERFKQKAFTMLELILVICIMSLVSAFTLPSFARSQEQQAHRIIKEDLPYFMMTVAEHSANYGEILEIKFDLNSKLIFIKKDDMIFKRFRLPKNFEYEDISGNKLINRRTTKTGNISRSFSLYSFNKENEAVSRKTFVNNRKFVQYLGINKYEPKDEVIIKDEKKRSHTDAGKWILVE